MISEGGHVVKGWMLVAILSGVAAGGIGLAISTSTLAQPMGQMSPSQMNQMMRQRTPMQPMTRQQMNQMRVMMQRQMAQMEATIKQLRAQLDKVKPDLLTGQERALYDYLKLLQTHLDAMPAMMQSMQGMMNMMPGTMMQPTPRSR